MSLLRIQLRGCGNPDYAQYADVSNRRTIEVRSWTEAVEQAKEYINDWSLGGGNWCDGRVYDGKTLLGHVSYNGRCWDKGPGIDGANEIDPQTGKIGTICVNKDKGSRLSHDRYGCNDTCSNCGIKMPPIRKVSLRQPKAKDPAFAAFEKMMLKRCAEFLDEDSGMKALRDMLALYKDYREVNDHQKLAIGEVC